MGWIMLYHLDVVFASYSMYFKNIGSLAMKLWKASASELEMNMPSLDIMTADGGEKTQVLHD